MELREALEALIPCLLSDRSADRTCPSLPLTPRRLSRSSRDHAHPNFLYAPFFKQFQVCKPEIRFHPCYT